MTIAKLGACFLEQIQQVVFGFFGDWIRAEMDMADIAESERKAKRKAAHP